MIDMLAYLKDQQEQDTASYQALREALKAFDTGLLLMFLYGDADVQHSREHGGLPEGAVPLEIALKHSQMASHTGGGFAEPWYIAKRLREVAATLENTIVVNYEKHLASQRMQSSELNVTEAHVNKIPQYEERCEVLRVMLLEYDREWNGAEGEAGNKDAGVMTQMVQSALDLGVPMPVTESQSELVRLYENLGDLINNELAATDLRLQRARDLAKGREGASSPAEMDAVAMGGSADAHAFMEEVEAEIESEEEQGLFDT